MITQKNSNVFLVLFLCCWASNTFMKALILIFGKIPIIGGFNYIIYDILICSLVLASLPMFRYLKVRDIIVILLMIFSVLTGALYDNFDGSKNGVLRLIFTVYSFYFIGRFLNINSNLEISGKKYKLTDLIYVLSVLGILSTLITQIYAISTGSYNSVYENSAGATYTKFLVGYCFFYMFRTKKTHSFVSSVVGLFAMFSYGNRASLLATFIMLFIAYIMFNNKKTTRELIKKLLIVGAIIIGYMQYDSLLNWFYNLFAKWGFNTRIIKLFMTDTNVSLLDGNGRDIIYLNALKAINERPLTGYGIFGDRSFLGGYVHNLVLEFLMDYGVIIGSIFLIFLCIVLIKGVMKYKNDDNSRSFLLVLIISEITMLIFSGSYLQEPYFFMMLGFAMAPIIKASEEKKTQFPNKEIGC